MTRTRLPSGGPSLSCSSKQLELPFDSTLASYPQATSSDTRLVWWKFTRHHGQFLPAEPGVILFGRLSRG